MYMLIATCFVLATDESTSQKHFSLTERNFVYFPGELKKLIKNSRPFTFLFPTFVLLYFVFYTDNREGNATAYFRMSVDER